MTQMLKLTRGIVSPINRTIFFVELNEAYAKPLSFLLYIGQKENLLTANQVIE